MNQKGFTHILVLILLLAGLIAGVYLVTSGNPLKLFSKAKETKNQSKTIEKLTQELLVQKDKYEKTGKIGVAAEREQVLNFLVSIAARRKEELLKAIEENPEVFLAQANLIGKKESFPKEIQSYLEEEVNISGEVSVAIVEDFKKKQSETRFTIADTKGNDYALFFDQTPNLLTGSRVRIKGIKLDQKVGVASKNIASLKVAPAAGALAAAEGNKRVAIILFKFDDADPATPTREQMESEIFSSVDSVANYYGGASFDKISVSGDIYGWYKVSADLASCNKTNWYRFLDPAHDAAVAAGVDLSRYDYEMYVTPQFFGECGLGGVAQLRGRRSLINWYTRDVVAHELGHNLGAFHAGSLSCGDKAIDDYANCTKEEYGERFDVMGTGYNHFNAPHKLEVGWVPQSRVQTITANGTYTVTDLNNEDSGVKVLKIGKADTFGDYYYLSYRQPGGFDDNLPTGITRGVNVHIWDGFSTLATKLLDTTPGSSNGFTDAALSDGATFNDSVNGIIVKQLSHDSNSATLEVKFNRSATPTPVAAPLSIGDWQSLTSMLEPRTRHSLVDYNGYLYLFGWRKPFYYTQINPDGTIGSWQETESLPHSIYSAPAVVFRERIYILGSTGSAEKTKVYSASINTDGSLGQWSSLNNAQLPKDFNNHAATVAGNYIFIMGGNGVYSSAVNSSGNLEEWRHIAATPANEYISYHQLVYHSGYLYLIGGYSGSTSRATVYSARVNEDGTLEDWQETTSLPQALDRHTAVVWGNYLFVLGGHKISAPNYFPTTLSNVYAAEINNDGTLGSWSNLGNKNLPKPLENAAGVTAQGRIYISGGVNNSSIGMGETAVYSSRIEFPSPFSKLTPGGRVTPAPEPTTTSISPPASKIRSSSFSCTACLADVNKDKNVNISDISLWSYCRVRGISSSPKCVNADLDKDGKVGGDPEFKCITSQYGKKC